MIEDVFFRRYPQQIYWGDRPTAEIHQLFVQVAHIIFGDLVEPLQLNDDFFKRAHDALARETGRGRLYDAPSWDVACGEFLTEMYDLWKDRHGTADTFLKMRLSLVELLFRLAEERARELSRAAPDAITRVARAIDELNSRFRQARMGMHYHNGILQFARDELTETRIAEPCWALLRDAKWANVDRELKEAIEHADAKMQPFTRQRRSRAPSRSYPTRRAGRRAASVAPPITLTTLSTNRTDGSSPRGRATC